MTPAAARAAAQTLAEARRAHRRLDQLPAACRPLSAEDGYAAQAAFIEVWGEPVAGWKAGATAEVVQKKFKLGEPFLGPMFASTVVQSPARLETAHFAHKPAEAGRREIALEVEFAFRVGRLLPASAKGYARDAILDAMEAMIPALEVIAPRFAAVPFDSVGEAIADCGLNGGLVLGKPVQDWRGIDYANHRTRQLVDGKSVFEGTGAAVLGHPFNALEWLVNAVTRRGYDLEPGQLLTTGSTTGIVYVPEGTAAVGDFGTLGTVEVRFV